MASAVLDEDAMTNINLLFFFCRRIFKPQDTVDVKQGVRDSGVVRLVDIEPRRTGKRVGYITRRGQRARDFGRGIGQDAVAAKEIVAGWFFARRSAGPVRGTHVPQATGRCPDPVLLDSVAQDLSRRKLPTVKAGDVYLYQAYNLKVCKIV